ncbi:hypothetical protein KJI95_09060 [Shewanella sp. JM162201]|uniref:Lipoprotein n=1 Tax=Shewanella jiangmenensis TaxID=2837387 RepID=A0ABS5V2J6_9GAMM|nr:YajG family lipoprotein [Shewanella jiangmenensis]MBT1444667.1 hypothetical protein [Shewanella jiangmenensis]
MKKTLIMLSAIAMLGGCAGRPSNYLVLSPDTPAVSASAHGSLALRTDDARNNQTAVLITTNDDAKKTYTMGEPPAEVLGEVFRKAFSRAGYDLDPGASNSLEIKIERLQSNIKESMLGYEASNEIVISTYARNQQQIFTKRYNIRGTMKGPMSLDLATLELELNKLLTKLAGDIVNDGELHQFLSR